MASQTTGPAVVAAPAKSASPGKLQPAKKAPAKNAAAVKSSAVKKPAAAAPSKTSGTSNHPTYIKMILAALKHLKER